MANPLPRHFKVIDDESARADVRAGRRPNYLKKKYGIGYGRACDIWRDVQTAMHVEAGMHDFPTRLVKLSDEGDHFIPSLDAAWDLTLNIPEQRADDILASFSVAEIVSTFTLQDKMDCITAVLQYRLDHLPMLPPELRQPNPESRRDA